jgi:hypothetical protein
MKELGITVSTEFEQALGAACLAPAFVAVGSISAGTPLVSVTIPRKNEFGVTFAEIESSLRNAHIILNFRSPGDRRSLTCSVSMTSVKFHLTRPKKRSVARVKKA